MAAPPFLSSCQTPSELYGNLEVAEALVLLNNDGVLTELQQLEIADSRRLAVYHFDRERSLSPGSADAQRSEVILTRSGAQHSRDILSQRGSQNSQGNLTADESTAAKRPSKVSEAEAAATTWML